MVRIHLWFYLSQEAAFKLVQASDLIRNEYDMDAYPFMKELSISAMAR